MHMQNTAVYHYFHQGSSHEYTRKEYTVESIEIAVLKQCWRHVLIESKITVPFPFTNLEVLIINLGYGMYYRIRKGDTKISENFCCFDDFDKEKLFPMISVITKNIDKHLTPPPTDQWIYTTYYNPEPLTEAEKVAIDKYTIYLYFGMHSGYPFRKYTLYTKPELVYFLMEEPEIIRHDKTSGM